MSKQIVIFGLLVAGLAGALVFFPMRLPGGGLCLADAWKTGGRHAGPERWTGHTAHMQAARDYLVPYGLLWWASLALLFAGGTGLRRLRRDE